MSLQLFDKLDPARYLAFTHLLFVPVIMGNFRSSLITLELIIGIDLRHFSCSLILSNGSFLFFQVSLVLVAISKLLSSF